MTNFRKRLTAAASGLVGLCLVLPNIVQSEPMDVTATVDDTCRLSTIADAAFGNIAPGGGDLETSQTFTWSCTPGTGAEIRIDNGLNNDRTMEDTVSLDTIAYELSKTTGSLDRWGDTGSEVLAGLSGGGMTTATPVTVYAQIADAAYEDAIPGDYADTVTVSIVIIP